jgi:hypothetical protein
VPGTRRWSIGRAFVRSVAPHSCLRRRISRTRRIGTLSAGVGPLLDVPSTSRGPSNAQRSSACHPLHPGGRLQIGMAEIKSESVADFIPVSVADPRNMHRTGLLSSILPRFGFATSRTQRE